MVKKLVLIIPIFFMLSFFSYSSFADLISGTATIYNEYGFTDDIGFDFENNISVNITNISIADIYFVGYNTTSGELRPGDTGWINYTGSNNSLSSYLEAPTSGYTYGGTSGFIFNTNSTPFNMDNLNSSVFYINSSAGKFAKVKIISINQTPNYPTNETPTSITFEYTYQDSGSRSFASSASDDQAPTVTLNTTNNTRFGSTSVELICSAVDNIMVSNISLYGNWSSGWHLNETKTSTTNNTQKTFTKTIPEGDYVWNCYACDNSSNCSFATINGTFTVDTTKPSVNLMSPANASTQNSSGTITFSYNVSDRSNISSCSLYINGSLDKTDSSITKNTQQDITTILSSGSYYWNINCTDSAGNSNISMTRIVNIVYDLTPPDLTNVIKTSLGNNISSTKWYNKSININISAIDSGVGLDKIEYRNGTSGSWTLWTTNKTFSNNITGNTIQFRANDTLGNLGAYISKKIKIDKIKPEMKYISLSSPIVGQGKSVTVEVNITDSLSGINLTYIIINGTSTELSNFNGIYSAEITVPSIDGNYSIYVNASDNAGNINYSFITSVKVNGSIPTITADWKNGSYISNKTTVTFTFGNFTNGTYNVSDPTLGTETLISMNLLDGSIVNYPDSGSSSIYTTSGYQNVVGDWEVRHLSAFSINEDFRSFLTFNLSTIDSISSASLLIMEIYTMTNNQPGVPRGDALYVDHLNYGTSLDASDYSLTATNSGFGTITPVGGDRWYETGVWHTLDVTTQVNQDLTRGLSQYRLRYQNGGDEDGRNDYFRHGVYGVRWRYHPKLIISRGVTSFNNSELPITLTQSSSDSISVLLNITNGVTTTVKNYTYYFDTTVPTISIDSPLNKTTANGTVTITTSATDAHSGVAYVDFYINGTFNHTDNQSPYTFDLDTLSLDDGNYLISANVTDNVGNKNSDYIVLTVNNNITVTENVASGTVDLTSKNLRITRIQGLNSTTASVKITSSSPTGQSPDDINESLMYLNITADTSNSSKVYFKIPKTRGTTRKGEFTTHNILTSSQLDDIYVWMDHDEDGTYDESVNAVFVEEFDDYYEFYFITTSFSIFAVGTLSSTTTTTTTSSSGGSGGSSSQIVKYITNLIDKKNYGKMSKNDKVHFSINNEQHSIEIDYIVPERSVQFKVSSIPKYITLDEGQTKKVDVDDDGTLDLMITLHQVKTNSINVTFEIIEELIEQPKEEIKEPIKETQKEEPKKEVVTEEIKEPVEKESNLKYYILFLGTIIIIIFLERKRIIKYIKKKKK